MKLINKIKFQGTITCHTGLHIGASKESARIGGVDAPVVRNPIDNRPYIPGSSLKGKIRSLLEQSRGAAKVGDNPEVNRLFGMIGIEDKQIPSRIIVRDAFMTDESANKLDKSDLLDLKYTEIKMETAIDRVLGKAADGSLRTFERVPAGSQFRVEIILNHFEGEESEANLSLMREGIELLNNDYLGGNGTRGYGHVFLEIDQGTQVYPQISDS